MGFSLALAAAGEKPKNSRPGPSDGQTESVPFISGKEGYACYRTPAVVVSPKGTVLAFCGGRVKDHRDEGDIDIVLKRSTDGGQTWGSLQVLANDGPNPCKGATPVVLPSGRILLLYLWNASIPSEEFRTTRKIYLIHSDDDGLTWSPPRDLTASVYREGWRWYGLGPCHAIVKRSDPAEGRIVVPARHNTQTERMKPHVILSDDGGETWRIGGILERKRASEGTVVELSDGSLMINCRNQKDDEDFRVVATSQDGGESFPEVWLEKQLVEPRGCQGSLLFHSLNPVSGKGNILFSNPDNTEMRSDGTLKLSEDDGRTWTKAFRYAPKPAPNFTGYSDIALFPDSSVGVLYERGELEDADEKSERYDEIAFVRVPWELVQSSSPRKP